MKFYVYHRIKVIPKGRGRSALGMDAVTMYGRNHCSRFIFSVHWLQGKDLQCHIKFLLLLKFLDTAETMVQTYFPNLQVTPVNRHAEKRCEEETSISKRGSVVPLITSLEESPYPSHYTDWAIPVPYVGVNVFKVIRSWHSWNVGVYLMYFCYLPPKLVVYFSSIQGLPGLNLGHESNYPDWGFSWFPLRPSTQMQGQYLRKRPWLLPLTSLPTHHSATFITHLVMSEMDTGLLHDWEQEHTSCTMCSSTILT